MVQRSEPGVRLFIATPKEYIATLPRYQFEGRIIVVQGHSETARAVQALSKERILGFDTETRPVFRKGPMRPPALIQLATRDTCFLFRIHHVGIAPELARLLNDPKIIKVGISLGDDRAALNRTAHIEPQGWIDLQNTAKTLGLQDMGLARLFANVFGRRISKSQQRSNWEADVLSEAQKLYAATDADACLRLHHVLQPLLDGAPYALEDFPKEEKSSQYHYSNKI